MHDGIPPRKHKTGKCKFCEKDFEIVPTRFIRVNGAIQYSLVCPNPECKRQGCFGEQMYLENKKVEKYYTPTELYLLPTILPDLFRRCVVCGNRYAEEHHWFPRGIAGKEAEKWPKDYLCVDCHRRWHISVTPELVKDGKEID